MGAYLKGFLVACQGIPATVFVSVLSVIIGSAAGLLLALMRTSKSKVLNWISKVYVDIVRGTPMVVQALIFAYGIPQFMQAHVLYFKWANLIIPAIIVCGLNSAAYMSEVIRSGIQAVDKGQMEAARSLGMSKSMAMKLIIIPQAIKIILPAVGNEFVTLIKETSVLSFVGVVEILRKGTLLNAATYQAFPAYIGVALAYMLLTIPLSKLIGVMEDRSKNPRQVVELIDEEPALEGEAA
ncbi:MULTISPECIES: amino acid ABC transporter permease [Mogibacterium]|jgi:amino ABC transporter, permease protein, 3-TM region, his/glu/gln/arg/opine family|uniref:Amino acid ABC transporter permease n=1 Tax=Mogibacterium timidum TaxID=35519 RepID=A0A7Y8VRS2_9FIRM|nr:MULTISPECIES: amino acid ABC transporter permease [Mogibacterium]EJU21679.1 ABC transporter, permease protein [Mogibacterium sp. CM50]NWO23110.1 amino acid ABC transporter permease [Mogibacterium timidum]